MKAILYGITLAVSVALATAAFNAKSEEVPDDELTAGQLMAICINDHEQDKKFCDDAFWTMGALPDILYQAAYPKTRNCLTDVAPMTNLEARESAFKAAFFGEMIINPDYAALDAPRVAILGLHRMFPCGQSF